MPTILMCPPDYFAIEYEINPWMNTKIHADKKLAKQQWQALYETIKQSGAEVELMQPVKHLPDIVFTANAALLLPDNSVYLAHFHCPERQGERQYYRAWFEQQGYHTIDDGIDETKELTHQRPYFEGAGDGLYCGDTLFAGYGFRSDKAAFNIVKQHGVNEIIYCELQDPYFYHLDTCFCPLDDDRAIWWPEAFTSASQQRMQQAKELIAVPAEDAKHFACNAVVLGKHIIIPKRCQQTAELLTSFGFTVHTVPMSEYIKSGGACKCLTLRLS